MSPSDRYIVTRPGTYVGNLCVRHDYEEGRKYNYYELLGVAVHGMPVRLMLTEDEVAPEDDGLELKPYERK